MRPSWLEFENSSLNSGGFVSVRAIQIHNRDSKLNFSAPLFPTIIQSIKSKLLFQAARPIKHTHTHTHTHNNGLQTTNLQTTNLQISS